MAHQFELVIRGGPRQPLRQSLREFWAFLKQEKKYWLAPIVLVLLLFGLLLVFAQTSAVAPLPRASS